MFLNDERCLALDLVVACSLLQSLKNVLFINAHRRKSLTLNLNSLKQKEKKIYK